MLLQLLLARLKHTAITIQDNKNMASMCFILIPQVKKKKIHLTLSFNKILFKLLRIQREKEIT